MKKRFVLEDKVWIIEVAGNNFTTSYGGTHNLEEHLKSTVKEFSNEEKCLKEAEKLIKSKTKKGYEEFAVFIEETSFSLLKDIHEALKGNTTTLDIRGHGYPNKEALTIICTLTGLESLRMQLAGAVPDQIGDLTALKRLDVSFSGKLPNTISKLTNLETLGLYNENMSPLCAGIGELVNLKELTFNAEPLKEIPAYIGNLKSLEILNTEGNIGGDYDEKMNRIVKSLGIPKEIGQLEALRELTMQACDLVDLPDEIANLKNLKELKLDYNLFKEIPASICKLTNLEELDFTGNEAFCKIPIEFCQMTNLEEFDFEIDQVKDIPQDVLYQGVKAIQEYLGKEEVSPSESEKPKPIAKKKEEPELVESIPPAPENKAELIKRSKNRFDDIIPSIRKGLYRVKEETLDELYQFIIGDSDVIIKSSLRQVSDLENLPLLLNPIEEWNYMDDRLLIFMSSGFYFIGDKYAKGYHEKFIRDWFGPQLKKEQPGENLFGLVAEKLEAVGIDEKQFVTAYLDESFQISFLREDGSINSLGQVIQKYLENETIETYELIDEHSNLKCLVPLLVNGKKEVYDLLIPRVTSIRKYKGSDGNKHLPLSVFYELCKQDASPYEQIILDRLEETNCPACLMEGYAILCTYFGDKYRKVTVEKAKETVSYISTKRNEDSKYEFNWSTSPNMFRDDTVFFFQWITENIKEELKDDLINYVSDTKLLNIDIVSTIVNCYGQEGITAAIESLDMSDTGYRAAAHFRQAFSLLEDLDFSDYYKEVWDVACSSHMNVASHAIMALSSCPLVDILPKAKELLISKKSEERMAAVSVLCHFRTEETLELVKPLLDKEKKDEVRNVVVKVVYASDKDVSIEDMRNRVFSAVERKKVAKAPLKFLDALPKLKWNNGDVFTKEELYYIFYRQKCANEMAPETEGAPIYDLIDKESGAEFASKLMSKVTFTAANKMAFAFLGKLGGEGIIAQLEKTAVNGKNLNVCTILGMMGTKKAARALDRIIQHFSVKYPNVRGAAEEAFENIADALDLTYFELKDEMLPTFGFENKSRALNVGGGTYQMQINTSQKFEFIDQEGKKSKSISKAPADIKKELKEDTALLKRVVKQLKNSLETYLVTQRFWVMEDWQNFFLQHPLAFSTGQSLVWIRNGSETFVVTATEELINQEGNTIQLSATDEIKMVHPLHLETEVIAYWNTYLSKNKLTPVFNQLDREVIDYETDHGTTMVKVFEGKEITSGTFKYRAQKQGWKRGSIGDGGGVNSYRKNFGEEGIEVFIQTENLNVQAELNDEEMTLEKLFFTRSGMVKIGSFFYEEPRNVSDERIIKLEEVPKIVYSEAMRDINEVLGEEQE